MTNTNIGGTRIGNQIKAGYYQTPITEVGQHIQKLLVVDTPENKNETQMWLDPCAGEGLILQYLADTKKAEQSIDISTYAVELDKQRFEECKQRVDVSVRSAFEHMKISNNSFSFIYLNPPYNSELSSRGQEKELMEENFLIKAHRYLKTDGIMMYVVPANRYSIKSIQSFLSSHYTDIQLARFDDENGAFDEFNQVVFIGRKLADNIEEENEPFLNDCRQMIFNNYVKEHIPTLSLLAEKGRQWLIPTAKKLDRFQFSTKVDFKSSFHGITETDGFETLERLLGKRVGQNAKSNKDSDKPKMPIAAGQLGLLLCTGYANGEFGSGPTYHVAQGSENVYYTHEAETLESRTIKEVVTQKRRAKFIIATPDGMVKQLV